MEHWGLVIDDILHLMKLALPIVLFWICGGSAGAASEMKRHHNDYEFMRFLFWGFGIAGFVAYWWVLNG